MIKFPLDFIIDSINDCCFIYFKDTKHLPDAPPHFYFLIPIKEDPENVYLISIVTSQFEKRLYYYQKAPNKKAAQSLVRLEKGIFDFITRESAIDCNAVEKLNKNDLLKRIDKNIGLVMKEHNIDIDFLNKIIGAIKNSPLVPPDIKSLTSDK